LADPQIGGTGTDHAVWAQELQERKDEYAKEQMQEYRDRMAAEEAVNPTAYKGFKDIQGIGDFGGIVAETVGEVPPDIASFLLGAGAGTLAGKAIAK
jgi:outer membrane lipoprotein SlyB